MPNHDAHCTDSLKRYGKSFSELHSWMDEPSLLLGASHRKYRHDQDVTPFEAKAIFGELADHVCLDHIRLDELESRKSITTVWLPNKNYHEINGVNPVINFTIQSPAGAWHFQSEAGSISKDGKKCFCFRSTVLSKNALKDTSKEKVIIEEEEEEVDEDEEWLECPDNNEGEP